MRSFITAILSFLIVLLLSSFAAAVEKEELRVLFIGNSLTYTNDLPDLVPAIARASNKNKKIFTKMIAEPNFSLEDHWIKGQARKAISAGSWDFVVMQQGPSASDEGRQLLLEYSKKFADEIRKAGAKPALYSVWPPNAGRIDFTGVISSYGNAASQTNSLLLPVGPAWLESLRRDPSVKLYGADGFHPSPRGTLLAAATICRGLLNESIKIPTSVSTASGLRIVLTVREVQALQQVVEQVFKV